MTESRQVSGGWVIRERTDIYNEDHLAPTSQRGIDRVVRHRTLRRQQRREHVSATSGEDLEFLKYRHGLPREGNIVLLSRSGCPLLSGVVVPHRMRRTFPKS